MEIRQCKSGGASKFFSKEKSKSRAQPFLLLFYTKIYFWNVLHSVDFEKNTQICRARVIISNGESRER